jgi:hypothetical protein
MTDEDRLKLLHYGYHAAQPPCPTCHQLRSPKWETLCGVKVIYAKAVQTTPDLSRVDCPACIAKMREIIK